MPYNNNFVNGQELPAAELNVNFQSLIDDWYAEEDLTSQVNGVAVVFTTAEQFEAGKLRVFIDGLRRRRGVDFSESGPNSFAWLLTPPEVGQTLVVEYQKKVV